MLNLINNYEWLTKNNITTELPTESVILWAEILNFK